MSDSQQGVDAHESGNIAAIAGDLKSSGYSFVAQYIDQYGDADLGSSGSLTYADATTDLGAGLGVVSIFETTDMSSTDAPSQYTWETYLTQTQATGPDGSGPPESQGTYDATEAYKSALALGQPTGTAIYFAMDFDPAATSAGFTQADAQAAITSYFQSVDTYFALMASEGGPSYQVGVYGAGQTLEWLTTTDQTGTSVPLATYTWRTGSTGWEGPGGAGSDSSGTTATDGTPWTMIQTIPGVSTSNPQDVDGVPVDYDTSHDGSYGAWTTQNPPCFVAGTMIATPGGDRAVETLAAGDLVRTADGAARPVRWLGRSTVSRIFADPLRVLPVRIRAGALGNGLPARDLLVSPGHAVLIDGVLVQAGALVNGGSVAREAGMPEVFTYYHVELDDHALLLAEGSATESFLDGGEAMAFDNAAERPAAGQVGEMAYPRAKSARQLPLATRAKLAAASAAECAAAA